MVDHRAGEPLVIDESDGGEIVERGRDLIGLEPGALEPAFQFAPTSVADAEQAKRPVLRRATRADRAFAVGFRTVVRSGGPPGTGHGPFPVSLPAPRWAPCLELLSSPRFFSSSPSRCRRRPRSP